VGFNLIKGIGVVRMQGLVAYFGDLQTAWGADSVNLAEASLGAKVIERVLAARQNVDLDQVWAKIESQGIKILTWQD
jgi:predicted Rossmann fold nucleotide-binding protein DprA/Smf involved in DNA uptake